MEEFTMLFTREKGISSTTLRTSSVETVGPIVDLTKRKVSVLIVIVDLSEEEILKTPVLSVEERLVGILGVLFIKDFAVDAPLIPLITVVSVVDREKSSLLLNLKLLSTVTVSVMLVLSKSEKSKSRSIVENDHPSG
jgi:hypothetical protein